MEVFWSVLDPESGIHAAMEAIGTEVGAQDILAPRPATTIGHTLVHGLQLQQNTEYFFTLVVTNNAGLSARIESSVTVDLTPPTCEITTPPRYVNLKELNVLWTCQGAYTSHTLVLPVGRLLY